MDSINDILEIDKLNDPKCKGIYFRVSSNDYVSHDGIYHYQLKIYPLKRMSCRGCAACECLLDDYKITGEMPLLPKGINDGDIVELKVIRQSRDWETGIIDGFEPGFVKIGGR